MSTPFIDPDGAGLYPTGNPRPPEHLAAGLEAAETIVPGPDGKVHIAGFGGMSNAFREWAAFSEVAAGYAVKPINVNRPGWDAVRIVERADTYWAWVRKQVAKQGSRPQDIQVGWLKNSVKHYAEEPPPTLPEDAKFLQDLLWQIIMRATGEFPNLKMVFITSANYSGYSTKPTRREPGAWQEGFASKWLIAARLGVTEPVFVDWGPYLWADGLTPRSDGLTWPRNCFASDGLHPSPKGNGVIANLLLNFFANDPLTAGWFRKV